MCCAACVPEVSACVLYLLVSWFYANTHGHVGDASLGTCLWRKGGLYKVCPKCAANDRKVQKPQETFSDPSVL